MVSHQLGVKHQCLLQQFFVLLLFSCTPLNCNCAIYWQFNASQLDALQVLWGEWSQSTPNLSINLAGWNSAAQLPNWPRRGPNDPLGLNMERFVPCTTWRGVQCLSNVNCTNAFLSPEDQYCNVYITGLTLNSASLVGTLPPAIGSITTLLTLELTGNPQLTGNLPNTIGNTNLYILDLHDNGFSGELPDFGNNDFATKVDLSGNNFNGSNATLKITNGMVALQTLNLGRNNFEGNFLYDNKTYVAQLVELDLSSNRFNGTVPILNFMANLEILNLSENSFTGRVPYLPNSSVRSVDLSGNGFNGPFPLAQISGMGNLRMLDLSRNDFDPAEIPSGAFENMTQLVQLNLSNNRFNGSLPSFSMINSLQILDLSNNNFTGILPMVTTDSSLQILNLSKNAFTGPAFRFWSDEIHRLRAIIPGIANYSLKEVYLDSSLIDGTLDISLLSEQGLLSTRSIDSLRVLSMMNNSISNVVYDAQNIESIFTVIRLAGNPYCNFPNPDDAGIRCFCNSPQSCSNSASISSNNNNSRVVITAVVTSVTSLLVLIIITAALLYRNRRYKRYLQLQVQQKFEEFEVKPTIFPYNQLRTATRDFHPDMKLGQGAFGAVYKGVLPNGHEIAVKQLFAKTSQGIDEFLNEVVLLTGMKHRNLVNLKGCCIREQQRVLVYEYVDNYDMDQILLGGPNKDLVSWPVRLKICLGVARGLHYLHALAHPRIIHRDIKASNILLTKNYESKIADFGLASLFPDEQSYIMTQHVAGTKGYLAPEYASYGQLSDKVDVFSFGVLCLEVVSGRRNINEKLPPDEIYLPNWAWELHRQGRVMDLIDPNISLQDEEKLEVQRLIRVSLLCVQMAAEQRPSMERVVAMLQGDSESEAVVLQPGNVEQGLKSMRLFAFGESGLGTVREEGESSDMESSFMDSSRRAAGHSEQDFSSFATSSVELSEIRAMR